MITNFFYADEQQCNKLAESIFMKISGIDKPGMKYKKMKKDAYRIRQVIDDRIKIRAGYVFYDNVNLEGKKATVNGGKTIHCNAFEQIDKETVNGLFAYALSVGDFSLPEYSITEQLYADIWGTAFTDAVRILLKEELESNSRVSDSFGPGFYGMELSEMENLAELIHIEEFGIEVKNSRILLPLKSCAGVYFKTTEKYIPINSECEICSGNSKGCTFCQISGGN